MGNYISDAFKTQLKIYPTHLIATPNQDLSISQKKKKNHDLSKLGGS